MDVQGQHGQVDFLRLVEKQGEHSARIRTLEDGQKAIHDDTREIRALLRQLTDRIGSIPPQPAPNSSALDQAALSMHRVIDALERRTPAGQAGLLDRVVTLIAGGAVTWGIMRLLGAS